jgi:hypothetical protein
MRGRGGVEETRTNAEKTLCNPDPLSVAGGLVNWIFPSLQSFREEWLIRLSVSW